MVVLPADQTVEDVPVFQRVLGAAAEDLATGAFGIEDPLVTLGIQVDRPATEYGYLIPDVARGADIAGLRAYPLVRFEEKPKPARAEELAKDEGVAWNAGIFLWRRRAIGQALDPLHRPPPVARADGRHAVEPASAPTRRSSGPSRSTTR